MNNKKLIKFYKGYILKTIHFELSKTDDYSIDEVDNLLKLNAGFDVDTSCLDLSVDEMQELIIFSFSFGDKIGLNLNYKDNDCDFIREL